MPIPPSALNPISTAIGRIGWGLAAVFMFMVFAVTALTALYLYLREYLPPADAMGLIAVLAGFVCLFAGWWAMTWGSDSSSSPKPGIDVEALIDKAVAKDPLGLVLGALAAGVVMESVPEVGSLLRRVLGDRSQG